MYNKINYTLVGVFVLLFTVALLGFGFWLAKYGFEQKYDYYKLIFKQPVDGLTMDSTVKLNGVSVGKVAEIKLSQKNPNRVIVIIKLKSGTPITSDMYATLNAQGITGLSYIQIEGGSEKAKRVIPNNENPPVIPTKPSLMHKLTNSAPEIIDKLNKTISQINRLLSNKNIDKVSKILTNSEKATKKAVAVEDRVLALSTDINNSLNHFNEASDRLSKDIHNITAKVDKKIDPVLTQIENASKNFAKLSKDLEERIEKGEYDLKAIIRPIKVDIGELSYQYQELAQDLKDLSRHPSSILFDDTRTIKGPGE